MRGTEAEYAGTRSDPSEDEELAKEVTQVYGFKRQYRCAGRTPLSPYPPPTRCPVLSEAMPYRPTNCAVLSIGPYNKRGTAAGRFVSAERESQACQIFDVDCEEDLPGPNQLRSAAFAVHFVPETQLISPCRDQLRGAGLSSRDADGSTAEAARGRPGAKSNAIATLAVQFVLGMSLISPRIDLRARYAMSGTERAYGFVPGVERLAVAGTALLYMLCYRATLLRYARARRCPVLTWSICTALALAFLALPCTRLQWGKKQSVDPAVPKTTPKTRRFVPGFFLAFDSRLNSPQVVSWNHVDIMKWVLQRLGKTTVQTRRAIEAAFHLAFKRDRAAMAQCLLEHLD
eukprot:3369914-Rhodomonas_salina.1